MVVKQAVLSEHRGCLQPLLARERPADRLPSDHHLLTRCWLLQLNSEYVRF